MASEVLRGLPTEILIFIVDQVEDDEDLLSLAVTCRQFHGLSLTAYFARDQFDPTSVNVALTPYEGSFRNLAGLALSLDVVGTSIDHLSYDFGYLNKTEQLIKELRLLTRYVSKLSSINRATLRVASYYNSATSDEWKRTTIALLNVILEKSCTDINIRTSQLSNFYEDPKLLRVSKPSDWLKNYWPVGIRPRARETQYLKVCRIQTFPTFLRPFYYHTLQYNSAVLTDLSFRNIFGGGADWGLMMQSLIFPRLTRLTVMYGVIPRDPFVKFLAKHQNIREFTYHHIRYDPRPKRPARIESSIFDQLHTLTTTPEHMLNFLPAMSKMPVLTNVVIMIEELVTNFSPLEGALRCLAACTNKITLTLEVTRTGLGFRAWLDIIVRNGLNPSRRPEPHLHCVQTLVMDNADWGFGDEIIALRLPAWLRLFPDLKALTLVDGGSSGRMGRLVAEDSDSETPTLLDSLKDACPGLYIEWRHRNDSNSYSGGNTAEPLNSLTFSTGKV
ncbi:hypothetical protein CVT26_003912 [Gymnopilus dilepis]|uniref:F-box domain-containing protein n=1 Tax=Gymnopilus dilepis TaxID=231916 RepID=A0A409YUR2_9AGAR|nr:hypothetical protein CVT26_003912 [Gymnopilus dilepis]